MFGTCICSTFGDGSESMKCKRFLILKAGVLIVNLCLRGSFNKLLNNKVLYSHNYEQFAWIVVSWWNWGGCL